MILTAKTVFTVKPDYSTHPIKLEQFRILEKVQRESEIASWYRGLVVSQGNEEVYLRVSVNTSKTITDLLKNEKRILTLLRDTTGHDLDLLMPKLVESFELPQRDGTYRVNVFKEKTGRWMTIEELRRALPNGFPLKQAAWIVRRAFSILAYTYGMKVMHGALTPRHILIHGPWHGFNLLDWEYAVHNPRVTHETINNIPFDEFFDWYPQWVFDLEGPKPYMDTVMAVRCIVYLLNGDPMNGSIPFHPEIEEDDTYKLFQDFFTEVIQSDNHDLTAYNALEQFTDDVLKPLWKRNIWEKTFYPFPELP